MAYATNTMVKRDLGRLDTSASSPITDTEVTSIIAEIDSQIDAVLKGVGVTPVPVTAADDSVFHAYLVSVSIWGSMASVLRALLPGPRPSNRLTTTPSWEFWQGKYTDALDQFRLGNDIPSVMLGDVTHASSYFTNNQTAEATLGALEGAQLFTVDDLGENPW